VYKQGGRTPLKWRKPLGTTFLRQKNGVLLKNKEFCREKRIFEEFLEKKKAFISC